MSKRKLYQYDNGLTEETLVNAGYKKYKPPINDSAFSYQKRYTDNVGVKYFISSDFYVLPPNAPFEYAVGVKVQFQDTRVGTINFELCSDKTLYEIELAVEELFNFYDKPYYEVYGYCPDESIYTHDFDNCTFLGGFDCETQKTYFDLYICIGKFGSSVIARYGNDSQDYQSVMANIDDIRIPSLKKAKERAINKGLIQ